MPKKVARRRSTKAQKAIETSKREARTVYLRCAKASDPVLAVLGFESTSQSNDGEGGREFRGADWKVKVHVGDEWRALYA